ncbi:class I SAM-dependent methyltransferase [Pseudorhodobacter sp. E13]|uniref:class I SAM-dependent methyltransferase n=1 Tax=Pseudorhodobacter sp. E13 TaxID=2487931 RepID=UPI000F8C6151|nr:class I SAM-dependent methyltransferase [Pseudorhodobacter sp. E13]RUS59719.1 class I SAM-dependent methyltransferase [Pseudorhodobacter sp. E13]
MRDVSDPQTLWDKFDAAMNPIAVQLERQMRMQRAQRRGFSGMIGKFEKQRIQFRNELMVMERDLRRSLKGPLAKHVDSADVRLLRLLRRRLHMMQRITDTMQLISKGKARPLYPPLRKVNDVERVQAFAMDTAMAFLHRLINPNPQSDAAKEIGCYSDIPLSSSAFIAHAHAAFRVALAQKRPEPLRFVDVGCGGGMKVLLAAEIFEQADGFDFDARYVDTAQKAMQQMNVPRCKIFEANALTFEGYDQYDVIYFYQPMSDTDQLEALEKRIAETARPGTILIAPYLRFVQSAQALNCGRIEEAVYVTGTPQKEADFLRAQAEKIGPQILRPAQIIRTHGVDWLRGLVLACAVNGHLVEKTI